MQYHEKLLNLIPRVSLLLDEEKRDCTVHAEIHIYL